MTETTYLRFDALLTEGLDVEPRLGWETPFVHTRPPTDPEGRFRVVLRGEEREVLAEVAPRVVFRHECEARKDGADMGLARVEAYVPLVRGAREIVLLHRDEALLSRKVAEHAPDIGEVEVEVDGEVARLSWTSGGEAELRHRVVAVIDDDRSHVVDLGTSENAVDIDLSDLPVGPNGAEARFAVLCSDGVRSNWSASEPIWVAGQARRIVVLEPDSARTLPAETPLTLSVQLEGWGPRQEDAGNFSVFLNEERIAAGSGPFLLPAFAPGSHNVRVQHDAEDVEPITQTLVVGEPSPARQRWSEAIHR